MNPSPTKTSSSRLQLIEWGLLLASLATLTITEQYRWYVTVGLMLLIASFMIRIWRTRHIIPHTGLEIPFLLIVLSGIFAAWISYDAPAAWLQMARIIAGCVLYYAVVESDNEVLYKIALGFTLAITMLAIYWPLQHDFLAGQSKFGFIDRAGHVINTILPTIPGPSIHSNVAAGTLVIGLPIAITCIWQARRRKQWLLLVILILCTLMIAGALLLTSSRGAWVGLGATICLAGLVWLQRRKYNQNRSRVVFWTVLSGLALLFILVIVASGNLNRIMGQLPDPTGTLEGRLQLWVQGVNLIKDYVFTGRGLMSFRMVYAVYGILIHVPHHDHLHNTYLEVWLEQGVLGAIGVVWILVVVILWAWNAFGRERVSLWEWAGLAAVAIAVVHGMFDVVFYVTRTLPLLGLVLGFAYHASGRLQEDRDKKKRWLERYWVGGSLIVLGVLAFLFYRPLAASAYANWGSIMQTRQELSIYDATQFDNPTLDLVRRERDMTEIEAIFNRSIALIATNNTALRRLAMIALSRGEYDRGLVFSQQAWNAGLRDEITRLVYGDALAASGQPESAAAVVRGISWAEGRLAFQAWYRYCLGVPPGNVDDQRCADAWRAVLALNPDYPGAIEALKTVEDRLRP